jgi:hypothetical protein
MAASNFRNAIVVTLVGALLLSNPFSAGVAAQMSPACVRDLDRQDAEMKAFGRDVKTQNLDFVSDDAVGQSLTDLKDMAKGKPDQIALRKLQDLKEKTLTLAKELMTFEEMMSEISTCLKGGPPRCLSDISGRQSAQYKKWLLSLGEETLSGAAERVNKARSLVQGYASKLMSQAENSISRGLENCIAETEKAVNQNKLTVDSRARPAQGGDVADPPAIDKGGLSGGTKALIFLGVVGGGAFLAKDSIAELLNSGGGSCSGTAPDTNVCFSGNGGAGNGPGCQAALAALDQYCASCGKKRGTLGSATECVAK